MLTAPERSALVRCVVDCPLRCLKSDSKPGSREQHKVGCRRVRDFQSCMSNNKSGPAVVDRDQTIEIEGKITSVLAGTMFRVELANKHEVLAHISGKMRKRFIRLTTGDRVKLEMSPYDLNKARIVYRLG